MDFTREPIIETVITPKEGCKIVVRSSKNVEQEEYFVDALEVVSFGKAIFFRSLEKPKAFLVPASDYEILEVREARMVLKNVGLDRSIKIGGGREAKTKEPSVEKTESVAEEAGVSPEEPAVVAEGRSEKKRDRRRQQRRRRGREEVSKEEIAPEETAQPEGRPVSAESASVPSNGNKMPESSAAPIPTPSRSSLLPPPPTLISETISRYKENILFKNAFYTREEIEAAKAEDLTAVGEPESKEKKFEEGKEQPQTPTEKEELSPFASFWDDITEPAMPPMPFIEEAETEEHSLEEPSKPEENKE